METTHNVTVRMLPRETGVALSCMFCSDRGIEPPHDDMLPNEACVGFLNGVEVCVMWPIRLQNTKSAIVEFMCTAPGLSAAEARTVILACLTDIESRLLKAGVRLLLACTPHPGIAREASRSGWTIDERQSTHLYKPLCYK